jgi:WD40 repeat protein
MPGGNEVEAPPAGGGNFTRYALSPDGLRLAPTPGTGVHLASGAFSRDGRFATSGGPVWDLGKNQEVFRIIPPIKHAFVSACAFHPEGNLLAVGGFSDIWLRPGWLQLWDVQSGRVVHTFDDIRYNVFCAAFSPDGRHLAAAITEPRISGKGVRIPADVRIWDVESRRIVRTLRGHPDGIFSISFSPDGHRLAAAGNTTNNEFPGSVHVWDVTTGEEVWSFTGKPRDANAVAFSPSGRFLVTGGHDGTVTLFDGTPLAETPAFQPLPDDR